MLSFLIAASLLRLLALHLSAAWGAPTVTGVDLQLPTTAFGGAIEAAAVNSRGDVFAADFVGGGAISSTAFGFFNQVDAGTERVLDLSLNPFFTASQGCMAETPLIAGARFLPNDRLLLTDTANQRVLLVQITPSSSTNATATATTFCADEKMLQPNDLALSTLHPNTIYLSGQNFSADTTAGASGDLWTCNGNDTMASQFPPELLARADIHRTNGIETSPDGESLYLSSATNVAGEVVANRIYRFALDKATGAILKQPPPTIFFNFTGPAAAVDIDGMRADVSGNLFVTRNGEGQVVKISPQGRLLQVISLPAMGGPSNLEFGGADGTTLFAVGKCAADATVGCAASFETNGTVGKAFSALQ